MPRRWQWLVFAWISAAVLALPAGAQVRVVATIFPVADVVRQVGGDAVTVATLLPAAASPHTFEPTPAQAREAAMAQVFVEVGAGLDGWAAKLRAGSGEAIVVSITAGIALLAEGAGAGDPHVWLDPMLVRDHVVPAIVTGLSRAAPDQGAGFVERGQAFQAALTALDADIRGRLGPRASRKFIAFHGAWRYFARRYGLEEVAVVEAFAGKEPSAREIAAVIERARAAQVRTLFVEPQFHGHVAEQIAREFGGRTVLVDPMGNPAIPGRDHYLDLMRFNSQAFEQALP